MNIKDNYKRAKSRLKMEIITTGMFNRENCEFEGYEDTIDKFNGF